MFANLFLLRYDERDRVGPLPAIGSPRPGRIQFIDGRLDADTFLWCRRGPHDAPPLGSSCRYRGPNLVLQKRS
jgi:hypothetical protein